MGDGALEYNPPLGKKMNKGNNQSLKVTVKATANYEAATKVVKINVK